MEKIGCLTINGTESLEGYLSTDSGASTYKDFEIVKGIKLTDQSCYATYLNFYNGESTDPTTQLYSGGLNTGSINCNTIGITTDDDGYGGSLSSPYITSTNITADEIIVGDATASTVTVNDSLNIGNVKITDYSGETTNTITITGKVIQNSISSYTVEFSQALLQSYSFTFYYTIYAWLLGFKVSSTHSLNVTVPAEKDIAYITIGVSSGNGISAYGVGSSFAKSFTFTQTSTNTNPSIKVAGNILPSSDGIYTLGSSTCKWDSVYAVTGDIQTSDVNQKNSIKNLDDKYYDMFDLLVPVSYKMNSGTSERTHTGLTAQNLKEAILSAGLTTKDVAAYCEWKNEDGNTECGIRYGELISIVIGKIQQLEKRIKELENK